MDDEGRTRALFALWAKLPRQEPVTLAYHPLPCHLIDVAAAAEALWERALAPATRAHLAAAFKLDEADAGRWVALIAALHDLGKASPAFQAQEGVPPALLAALEANGLRYQLQNRRVPHGRITVSTLPVVLERLFHLPRPVGRTLALVTGGHHGVFPSDPEPPCYALGGPAWATAREELVRLIAEAFGVRRAPVDMPRPRHATAMILAGLVTVADWLGSNTEYFPYAVPDGSPAELDLGDYVTLARRRAVAALAGTGWSAWKPRSGVPTFADLFPDITEPNPMQRLVSESPVSQGPSLVIIEIPMGEGKTEAALALAERWNAVLGSCGCYVGLPTRATSDQMFERVCAFLRRRYPDAPVQLQLLHGHAALSAEFALLLAAGDRLFQPSGVYDDQDTIRDGSVVAAGWFTHRKRGLLAPYGVGTVDQALLAVLQSKHVFVRSFGLAHKPVIIDEVHAYDVYMSSLLERLLEWLAALGSSVVLLSATLPDARRRALAQAFSSGLESQPRDLASASYPRVTWVDANGSRAQTVAVSSRAQKQLAIKHVGFDEHDASLVALLRERLAHGGCAAVICNTVARAQAVYRALQPHFTELASDGQPVLDLLHARFVYEDREARERRALARFGKRHGVAPTGSGPTASRPDRAVLVATQVIEQSLDLDFDLMVTDLAPIDLLLQRAGRLHRHERSRPPGLESPTLVVLQPPLDVDGPRFSRADCFVYDEHVLFRTWLVLQGYHRLAPLDVVEIPNDVESLIEEVYDLDRSIPDLSPALQERWSATLERFLQQQEADRAEAAERWLKRPSYTGSLTDLTRDPREEDAPEFHQAHQALTRLSEPSVQAICVFSDGSEWFADAACTKPLVASDPPTVDEARALLRRSVAITHPGLVRELTSTAPPAAWRRSPLLRHHRPIVFGSDGVAEVGDYRIQLDHELGLLVEHRAGGED